MENKEVIKYLKEVESNFNIVEDELIRNAKVKFGNDIFSNYFLPKNFNFRTLNEKDFEDRSEQEIPLPFSNAQFAHFIKMPKTAFNEQYMFTSHKGTYKISGVYLLGNDQGRPVLFKLSIVQDLASKNKDKYNIKLDMSVQGKTWLNLLRIDVADNNHKNFLVNGNPVNDVSEIKEVKNTHIHINSHEAQVYEKNMLSYLPAESLDTKIPNLDEDSKLVFKKSLDYLLNYANISLTINKNIINDYNFTFDERLLDEEHLVYIDTAKQIKELDRCY